VRPTKIWHRHEQNGIRKNGADKLDWSNVAGNLQFVKIKIPQHLQAQWSGEK